MTAIQTCLFTDLHDNICAESRTNGSSSSELWQNSVLKDTYVCNNTATISHIQMQVQSSHSCVHKQKWHRLQYFKCWKCQTFASLK